MTVTPTLDPHRQQPAPFAGRVRRALLSTYDKEGLVALGQALAALGVELIASGGTARALQAAGIAVLPVEEFTGSPEVLGGRVKTLHPKIHAALLADRRDPVHLFELAALGTVPIDLVVCNLYPFAETVRRGASPAAIIEEIDIGGPTLLRAAAKNADGGVAVLCAPSDYAQVIAELQGQGGLSPTLRRLLAARAFRHVAEYDAAIATWSAAYAEAPPTPFPPRQGEWVRGPALRYGENPHQTAYLYLDAASPKGVAGGQLLSGKPLSYNNYLDLDAAYRAVYDLPAPACAIIKHTSPCGLACADAPAEAFLRALAADAPSAFGSVLGFNREFDARAATALLGSKLFVECIVAPQFAAEAIALLAGRENLRLVAAPAGHPAPRTAGHLIGGGLLVQSVDPGPDQLGSDYRVVTQRGLEPGWEAELQFAMYAAWTLKSNAIAITRERALLGAGGGLPSRVDACELAIKKAGVRARGAFLASDAFFPFPDCVERAHAAGIVAIVQPGGSIRDDQSIAACDKLGLAMVFTGQRHFRH